MKKSNELHCYSDLTGIPCTKVFNAAELNYTIHVKLSDSMMKHRAVYQIDQIFPCTESLDPEAYVVDGCWVDLHVGELSKKAGLYAYAVRLVDVQTDDVSAVYFQFRIQNDNPETPYIYMNRAKEGE